MRAIHLRTEHLINPMGVDFRRPLLSWNCEGGIKQTAFRVVAIKTDAIAEHAAVMENASATVACQLPREKEPINDLADSPDAKDKERSGWKEPVLWDSGKVESSAMQVQFGGNPIAPRTRVLWKVTLWDEQDMPGDTVEAWFETGLPAGRLWEAKWISGDYHVHPERRYPVDCFRKSFSLESGAGKTVERARLYITACGLYEARLNGRKAGEDVMTPGITDYRKRIAYQTYDVTELLREDANILTVQLADGWYRGSCGAWGLKNQYGTRTKLLAQLEITFSDGSRQTVATDASWDWSNDGPIRFADNKDGEIVDSRMTPSYQGRAVVIPEKLTRHKGKTTADPAIPSASDNVPVREKEHLKGKLLTTPSGKRVLDFGQNIAGMIAFRVKAHAGQSLYLRFGELLDENGEFTQKNIQCTNRRITTPLQEVRYICHEGENTYHMTFADFGFQYMLVDTDVDFESEDFTAIAVRSDLEETGDFSCSNALLNQFFRNTLWSARNNFLDIPTDCPTRERHGWTGDAQIFAPTASFLFACRTFFRKFLRDMYDQQKENGCLPQIAPPGGVDFYMKCMDGSVGWADAGIIIPYVLWKQYQDEDTVREFLPGMRRYLVFMERRCGRWYPMAKRTGLNHEQNRYISNYGQAYGEWAEPDEVHHMTWKDCVVPHPEIATAYTAYMHDLMGEMEEALGDPDRAREDRVFADACRKSYQALRETEEYSLDTDRQASLVRPLAFRLLDEKQEAFARKRLIEAMDHFGWRVGTGFLSTPLIMDVLAGIDIEAAYRLLENEEMPGWLTMPKHGATTIWEAWEGSQATDGGIGSLDHYSKGAVCRWLFDTMCGIHVDGQNHFRIAPRPGGHFTEASASYQSLYGIVKSGWKRAKAGAENPAENESWIFSIQIPANCLADVILPDGSHQEAGPGEHTFRVKA
ncbi:MAG: family 78 glycoside hydrolase catalytic domain [Bilifractor sp.]